MLKGRELFKDPEILAVVDYRREVVASALVEAKVLEQFISDEVRPLANLLGEIELAA
jgi:hypothetical protein